MDSFIETTVIDIRDFINKTVKTLNKINEDEKYLFVEFTNYKDYKEFLRNTKYNKIYEIYKRYYFSGRVFSSESDYYTSLIKTFFVVKNVRVLFRKITKYRILSKEEDMLNDFKIGVKVCYDFNELNAKFYVNVDGYIIDLYVGVYKDISEIFYAYILLNLSLLYFLVFFYKIDEYNQLKQK